MRVAECKSTMPVYEGYSLIEGITYVMSGALLRQLAKIRPGVLIDKGNLDDMLQYKVLHLAKEQPEQGKSVFLFRSGGIGDVMFMIPLIKRLRLDFNMKIIVGTSPMYLDVFKGNPDVSELVFMPFDISILDRVDYYLTFEGIIEDKTKFSQTYAAIDLFLGAAGYDPMSVPFEDKIPDIHLTTEEQVWAQNNFSRLPLNHAEPTIGVQLQASSPIRDFPLTKMVGTIRHYVEQDFNIFLFGGSRQDQVGEYIRETLRYKQNVINLAKNGVSLRESILWASKMSVILAPDSAFIHIAAGLDIPVVGLYGCFPSMLRMRYYRNAIGLDSNVACAPSFIHGHLPCHKGDPSPCFSVISVEDIINAINHLLKIKKIDHLYPEYNEFVDGTPIKTMFSNNIEEVDG